MGLTDVLIVVTEADEKLELATRNLHWTAVVEAQDVNPVSLLAFKKVLVTASAVQALEERFK